MRQRLALLVVLWLSAGLPGAAHAQPFPRQDLPPELRPWVAWVLDGVPDHVCPTANGQAICVWPGRLRLDLAPSGGSFDQEAFADRSLYFSLPGDARRWPQGVRLDGKLVAVVERGGMPSVHLQPGAHRIDGRFLWTQLPDSLPIPPMTALLDLTFLGRPVSLPQREEGGLVWLRKEGGKGAAAGESLRLQAFRKIVDGIPIWVDTTLSLEVSGKAREVELRGAVLAGSVPVAVRGDLPARLDGSGRLRVQVRAGVFSISVLARLDGAAPSISAPKAPAPWPDREVWVFEADERIRGVRVSGPRAVDPSRTDLPLPWRKLPAFLLEPEARLVLTEVRRGEPEAPPDRIQLEREMWLGLSGRDFTVRDTFRGSLSRSWRLDLVPPGDLGRVAVDGRDQLVTADPRTALAGTELRRGALNVQADSRLPRGGALPAVGWSASVDQLGARLHLPPGWRVLGATGVDRLPGAWVSRWTLLGFFFVLLVALGVSRLAGWRWGLLALAAVGLSYHEIGAPFLTWLSLLGACAISSVAPEGRLHRAARAWWGLSVLLLALALAPFALGQIRAALFPQVAPPADGTGELGRLAAHMGRSDLSYSRSAAPEAMPAAPAPSSAGIEGGIEGGVPGGVVGGVVGGLPPATMAMEAEPRAAAEGKVAAQAPRKEMPKVASSRARREAALEQDPHALLQTGPGVPSWSWQTYTLSWSGPVDRDHRIRLFLLSPGVNLVLTAIRLALLALLAARLIGIPRGSFTLRFGNPSAVPLLLAALLSGVAPSARAQESASVPSGEILEQLRQRLTRPEPCAPHCLATPRLRLVVSSDGLAFTAEVHAGAKAAWAIPGPAGSWVPSEVRVDGRATPAVARLADGFLRVRLDPGVHEVVALGPLPRQDSLTLQLADRPRHAAVEAVGWEVAGIREDGSADESIQLSRRLPTGRGTSEGGGSYPPWLEVRRALEIGVSWRVSTTVRRVSPAGSPVSVRIPLLKGESLTGGDWESQNGDVLLALSRDQEEAGWSSTLEVSEELSLKAPEARPWSEVWRIQCGLVWECRAEGLPPAHHQQEGVYQPEFRPWPGETLKLRFLRPQGVKGRTLTIDEVRLEATPGVRLETDVLRLTARSSREDTLTLTLPQGALVQEVRVGGSERPIRPEGDRLQIPLSASSQPVEVKWQRAGGMRLFYSAPQVGLGVPAVNAHVTVSLPEERWLLLAWGPAWGPAVLFWGYLVFVLAAAYALGRVPMSPLRAREWWLLALGLAQAPTIAALTVVGLFFALAWRQRKPPRTPLAFDAAQVLLAVWATFFVASLYGAVEDGLLLRPDMQVAGNGSHDSRLQWYADRVEDTTPRAGVLSLPLGVYRLAMLLWSLWLAASLVRWAGWAWRCFSEGGVWRALPRATPPSVSPPAGEPPASGT